MKPLSDVLGPLPYHRAILDYLRTEEKDVWGWFASEKARAEHAQAARFDLLKTTYRLERDAHVALYGHADRARAALGLDLPLTLYQAQGGHGMNASVIALPGEAHLVFTGPVGSTLSADEIVSVLAHELAHVVLWRLEDGAYLTADQVLSSLASHPRAAASHIESARLFRLYTEVFADRGSLFTTGDPRIAIGGLLKLETGLADANADSYLRQADEIYSEGRPRTEGLSHPESFIRARALRLWSEQGEASEAEIERMISGPAGIDELDLLAQRRVAALTRRLVARVLAPPTLRTEPMLALARLFFPEFTPVDAPPDVLPAEVEPVRDYAAYVLLDFAAADPDLDDAALSAAFCIAEPLGIADRLEDFAVKELGLAKRQAAKLRKDAGKPR